MTHLLFLLHLLLFTELPGSESVETFSSLSAPTGGSVTIPCFYEQKYKDNVKYWCKGAAWNFCTTMVRTDSPQSSEKMSITDDPARLVFTLTMKNLQYGDSGYYWCAVEIGGIWQKDDHVRLYITVSQGVGEVWTEITLLSPERGGSVTIPCFYNEKYQDHVKYLCKGFNWASCITLIRTDSTQRSGDVSITDDRARHVFSVTMRNLQEENSDAYWCAAEINAASDNGAPLYLNVTERFISPTTLITKITEDNFTSNRKGASQSKLFVLLGIPLLLLLLLLLLVVLVVLVVMVTWMPWRKHKEAKAKHRDTGERRFILTPTTDPEPEVKYSRVVFKKPAAQNKPSTDSVDVMTYSTVAKQRRETSSEPAGIYSAVQKKDGAPVQQSSS